MIHADHYFAIAREREALRRRREAGQPPPWTDDPIFKAWRFTNVHRENDRTTAWFREHVRGPLSEHGDWRAIVEAVLIFRWFNRIESMSRVKDLLLEGWNTAEARDRLTGVVPLVTGAYMVRTPPGMNKLDGLLMVIDKARDVLPTLIEAWWTEEFVSAEGRLRGTLTQERVWRDLLQLDHIGSFTAGEIVWDLRWTHVLERAPDINTWTIAGPGCAHGLGYLVADDPHMFNYGSKRDQVVMLELMKQLLEMSRLEEHWPQNWQPWELHEVEMWCCEYAKYRSAMNGGKLKRRLVL